MNIEQVREYTLSLHNVTEDMPFGEDVVVYRVEGKIFVCLWLGNEAPRFAIKLSPERNIELRGEYDNITPAYHWNKKHWSDIYYEKFPDLQIKEWIEESYKLIISQLSKRLQAQYQ